MLDTDSCISANRRAVAEFLAAAESVPSSGWTEPVAPGKWSPAQIAEHVAISYEVATRALQGDRTMGSAPRFLRPIVRAFGFSGVLKRGAFPKAMKGPPIFAPSAEHPSLGASRLRLEHAAAAFEAMARELAAAGSDTFEHVFFGRVRVADYVRYSELHALHHLAQLPLSHPS